MKKFGDFINNERFAWKNQDLNIKRRSRFVWCNSDIKIKRNTDKNYVAEDINDTILPSSEYLNDEMKQHHLNHDKNLSSETKQSLSNYKNNSHDVNNHLRGLQKNKNATDNIKNIDKATNNKLEHDNVVYRGYYDHNNNEHIKTLNPGDSFTDSGYVSTSIHSETAKDFSIDNHNKIVHYTKILVPKGSKGHYLDITPKTQHKTAEGELLLHRGTTFKVLGRTFHKMDDGSTHHLTHLRVEPSED